MNSEGISLDIDVTGNGDLPVITACRRMYSLDYG